MKVGTVLAINIMKGRLLQANIIVYYLTPVFSSELSNSGLRVWINYITMTSSLSHSKYHHDSELVRYYHLIMVPHLT